MRFVAAVATTMLAGCDYVASKGVLAQMIEAEPGTTLQQADQQSATAIAAGAFIPQGSTIATDARATATLAALPGIFIQLEHDTALAVEHLEITKAADDLNYAIASREARLRLVRGVIAGATPAFVTYVDLQIITASGSFVAPAFSSFCIAADGDTVRATVAKGRLSFTTTKRGDPVIIAAGQSLGIGAGAAGDALVPHPAADDERARDGLGEASRVAQSAVGWGEQMRGQPPPSR